MKFKKIHSLFILVVILLSCTSDNINQSKETTLGPISYFPKFSKPSKKYIKEKRIERRTDMPENYRLGRSQEIIEYWLYTLHEGTKTKYATSSPMETQSN